MLLLIAHGQLLIFEKSRGASKIWKPTIDTHTCTCQTQELNEKWRSHPPSTALLQHLFFWGGGRHSHKNLFFVGWEISRACREDQGIAAGNGLRVQSCRIQKGWVERVEKGVNRKTKKSCTIFHHRPFSIYEKVHGIRTISLWRKKHMEKICIAQLKISSDWSLRGSFQSRFNLTLAR